MATSGSNRFWYEVYNEGVKAGVISRDDTIESAKPIKDDLEKNERETVDAIYTSIKQRTDDPDFDSEEATWFFDLAKAELRRRIQCMNENDLTESLLEEFTNANRSEAEQVSGKVAKYIDEKEEAEFTKKMRDPEYVPAVLRNNTSPSDLTLRWNQWIGQFTKDNSYQID